MPVFPHEPFSRPSLLGVHLIVLCVCAGVSIPLLLAKGGDFAGNNGSIPTGGAGLPWKQARTIHEAAQQRAANVDVH